MPTASETVQFSPTVPSIRLIAKGENQVWIGSLGGAGVEQLDRDLVADFKPPSRTIEKSPGFYNEWFTACRGGAPATCNFDYSGSLTETVLLGIVANRAGNVELKIDPNTLRATNNADANQYLTKEYRKGWHIDDIA